MRDSLLFAVLVLAVMLAGSSASGSIMTMALDQEQNERDENPTKALRVHSARSLCQTFVAGESGYLAQISLWMVGTTNQQTPATIRIVGTTEGGIPNSGNVLWGGVLPINLASGWVDIDISSSSPLLMAGVAYGIQLSNEDVVVGAPDDAWYTKSTGDPYASGKIFENRFAGAGWVVNSTYPNGDAAFKTFMIVPEPTTMALVVMGGLATLTKRMRRISVA